MAYSVRAVLASSGDAFELEFHTGYTAGSTTWVAGNAQVETATAAGTITTAGNATAIVTSAGMSGSPLTVTLAVALDDTATLWAAKARTALAANATVAARFSVGGTGTAITLTRLPLATYTVPGGTLDIFAANDATLNVALADATSAGITEAATSADTTAGVASDGCKVYDGDSKDFEGVTLAGGTVNGILIQAEGSLLAFTGATDDVFSLGDGEILLRASEAGTNHESIYTATASGPAALTVTVVGAAS